MVFPSKYDGLILSAHCIFLWRCLGCIALGGTRSGVFNGFYEKDTS